MEAFNLACILPLTLLLIAVLVVGITQGVRQPRGPFTVGLLAAAVLLSGQLVWLWEPIVAEVGLYCAVGAPPPDPNPCLAEQHRIILRAASWVVVPTVIVVGVNLVVLHLRDRRRRARG